MKFRFIYTLILSSLFLVESKAELVITELMQSNVSGLTDDLNNFPDSWVELYNDGIAPVNLSAYHIGLKKKIDKAYQLPDMEVEAGNFVVIYCDKEEQGLHTSFRLESNKAGEIYLFKDGQQIQMVEHPAFPAPDIAYGLDPTSGEWGYELTPTPGAANIPGICDASHILGSPVFSISGGIFYEPLSLTLSLPQGTPEKSEIRYTLDGSLPGKESEVFAADSIMTIESTKIVRAALYCDGWLTPFPVTQSYIFPDHEITLPVIAITTDQDYLVGRELGIYHHPYEEWRRPANFEYFENPASEAIINQAGEFKISGNSSRQWELKSYAIYANKRFGEKRFDHEFFPEQRPGKTDFKSLLLRNSGNDFYETSMRDAIIHNTVGNPMNLDYQAGRPCVIFINGEYKGLLNIRERSNEDNIYTHYDGLEDVDMFENWYEFKEGNKEAMDDIRHFVAEEGHTFEEYDDRFDIREYMDVHLVNFYYNNTDFPGNNIVAWKPQAEGGKWRLILKDLDYAMGLKFDWGHSIPHDFKILDWLHDPDYVSDANNWGNVKSRTAPFVNMENFEQSREEYLNRALIYIGDFLNSRTTVVNIDEWYEKIADEWPYHAALVGDVNGMSAESLKENVEYMKKWIKNRDTFFPKHFAEFYNLGEMAYLEVLQPEASVEIKYEVDDMPLTTGEFRGYYPTGREVLLNAYADTEESPITGWAINIIIDNSQKEEVNLTRRANSTVVLKVYIPEGASHVSIEPILGLQDTGINNIEEFDNIVTEYYDLNGLMVNPSRVGPGIYIRKSGNAAPSKIIIR